MILETIAEATRERVARAKEKIPYEKIRRMAITLAEQQETAFPFEKALAQSGISFICEVKKASPSKGIIAEEFPYVQIAEEYERAGASCISVLTEPTFFLGDNSYLTEIAQKVKLPLLRKDFVVDAYQIYEAKVLGASCVLLICSLLDKVTLSEYLEICHHLGLSALVEAHDEKEITTAVAAGARIIGINNRNLKNFEVDIQNSLKLRALVPDDILFIAESGIKTAQDVKNLADAGVDGVLIGETLMKSTDKRAMLEELKSLTKQ